MLFGHQNDDNTQNDNQINDIQPSTAPVANPLAVDPSIGVSLPVVPEELTLPDHVTDTSAQTASASDDSPAADSTQDDMLVPSAADDLLALKQKALEQLGPLVNHLEQSPEEKFRTTMMMIQSSDNQALISSAYEAAQAIPDDKVRAQALLDIVNEINYFTQKN